MIVLKTLFRDKEIFKRYINSSNLDFNKNCLIRVYSSICTPNEIIQISKDIKDVIPISNIIGGSCCGVVYNGEQFDNETLVIIEQFDNVKIQTNKYSFKDKSAYEVAKEINNNLDGFDISLVHILFGEHYIDIHQFVDEFNLLNQKTKIVGGATGEILPKNLQPYVLIEDEIVESGVVTASLISQTLNIFTEVNTAVEPITNSYNINKCDGENIVNIENISAVEWCKNIFGVSSDEEKGQFQNDILTLFPLILDKYKCNDVTRLIKYDFHTKNISLYCSKLNNNIEFKIGYVSPFKCVKKMYDICTQLEKQPLENLFFYSCLFRKSFLGNCAKWETSPFGNQICGVFMMGEISNINNKNEFLNGSCCFLGIGEDNSKKIEINFKVFDDLYKIKDENERILNTVLKKHNLAISEQNKQLLEKVIAKQSKAESNLYFDNNLQMNNSIKFSHDKNIRKFNKICLIQLENSELMFSRMEKEEYYVNLKNVINSMIQFIDNYKNYNVEYEVYSVNSNIVFFALKDNTNSNEFSNFVNTLYEKFQFVKLENRDEMFIFRFAIVEDESNLLECGLETLQKCKALQTYFLVYDKDDNCKTDFNYEMEVIHLLNNAIKNDWIVPYFQGIHDNKNKTINKYEALIRIKDNEGKIYYPGYFMEISKKYNIYSNISRIMINKVFNLFKDKKTSVSINLSAYDVNSKGIQESIFNNLENSPNGNFIFELLEDECFRDIKMLNEFIYKVKKYNVKIAIDDFGIGYSNFMEIAKIAPDFIKIDGSIVKNIDSDDISRKVLNNIVFLGNQLESELVAEFVENENIQIILEELGVDFSQGYYFTKPEPYEVIKDNIQ